MKINILKSDKPKKKKKKHIEQDLSIFTCYNYNKISDHTNPYPNPLKN